jgi:hypothetical protein
MLFYRISYNSATKVNKICIHQKVFSGLTKIGIGLKITLKSI